MVRILNLPSTRQQIGEGFGAGFATGTQQLLSQIGRRRDRQQQFEMQQQLQRQQQEQQAADFIQRATAISDQFQIPQQEAAQILSLPQQLQRDVLRQRALQIEESGLESPLLGILSTGAQQRPQMISDQQPVSQKQDLATDLTKFSPISTEAQLQQNAETGPGSAAGAIGQEPSAGDQIQPQAPQQVQPQESMPQAQFQQAQPGLTFQPQAAPTVPEAQLPPGARAQQRQERLLQQLNNPNLTANQRLRLEDQVQKANEKLQKQQEAIDKKTAPVVNQINQDAEAAEQSEFRLSRMEELIAGGNLNGPVSSFILTVLSDGIPIPRTRTRIGLPVKQLLSPESQEFQKLSTDFLKNAKQIFGARVTEGEIKLFLKTVPTLMMSDEGKVRVINNMSRFNQVALEKKRISDSIIDEHGGFTPRNFERLVEKQLEPRRNEILDQLKADIRAQGILVRRDEAIARRLQQQAARPARIDIDFPRQAGLVAPKGTRAPLLDLTRLFR
jgi:hypothetical protein